MTAGRIRALAVAAALVVAGGLAAGCGGDHGAAGGSTAGHDHAAMEAAGTMSEQDYIAMMIPHHRMALEMAEIVRDRGTDPAVAAMAARMIADQTAEIAEMERRHREWFGGPPAEIEMTAMDMAMMGMGMDMDELRTTDEPDRVFLRMMIPHHAGAIVMSDMLLASDPAPRGELADLARRIVAAQSTEIGQMQALRAKIAPPLG